MVRDLFILTDIIRSYENLVKFLMEQRSVVPQNYQEFELLEKKMIVAAILEQRNLKIVADVLGVGRTTLYSRMERLGISKKEVLNFEVSEIPEIVNSEIENV